jgi:hypothetical protein
MSAAMGLAARSEILESLLSVINLHYNTFEVIGSIGSATQYIPNPWGTEKTPSTDVWIQLTTASTTVWNTAGIAGFGIMEIEYIDDSGDVQAMTFGDITNLANVDFFNTPVIYYRPNMLSVTVAAASYNIDLICATTLMEWG